MQFDIDEFDPDEARFRNSEIFPTKSLSPDQLLALSIPVSCETVRVGDGEISIRVAQTKFDVECLRNYIDLTLLKGGSYFAFRGMFIDIGDPTCLSDSRTVFVYHSI